MLAGFLGSLTQLPLMARFALAMAIILVVPALCQKVRLPSVVGLLLAGVLFGPHGLHVGPKSHEVAHFFADVGKLLLMFFAGLEIDLVQFRRTGHRSLVFGLATFALPLASGILVGLAFGYGWLGAFLIGSLLASHTLLGYPIVQRLGLSGDEAVTVTVGATIFTDIASLMILAVCIPIHVAGFSAGAFLLQLARARRVRAARPVRARRPDAMAHVAGEEQGRPVPGHAPGRGRRRDRGRGDPPGGDHRRLPGRPGPEPAGPGEPGQARAGVPGEHAIHPHVLHHGRVPDRYPRLRDRPSSTTWGWWSPSSAA